VALVSRGGLGMLLRLCVWKFSQFQSRPPRVCEANVLTLYLGTFFKVVTDFSVDAQEIPCCCLQAPGTCLGMCVAVECESMAPSLTTGRAARDVLWAIFGLRNFRAGQLEAIEHVVNWRGPPQSLLCIMATGSGKVRDRH